MTPTSSPIGDSSDALFTSPDALAQALKRFLGSSDEAVDYLGRTLEVLASTLSSPQEADCSAVNKTKFRLRDG